jgi:hypothetical protein
MEAGMSDRLDALHLEYATAQGRAFDQRRTRRTGVVSNSPANAIIAERTASATP